MSKVRQINVFVSHAHEEQALAELLKMLFEGVSMGAASVWFSSDPRPSGGIPVGGQWRSTINEKLLEADFVIAIQTRLSVGRPWIIWESALAASSGKAAAREGQETGERRAEGGGIVPVVFGMGKGELANPLNIYQIYVGDVRDQLAQLCVRLVEAVGLTVPAAIIDQHIDAFLEGVELHGPRNPIGPEKMELWRDRIEDLVRSARASEVPGLRSMMYASLGKPFEPTDPSVHELLSRVLLDLERFEDALKEVDRALSVVGEDAQLLHRKALILAEMGDRDTALKIVTRTYELDENLRANPELAGLEGRLYREQWQTTQDPEVLEQAIEAYTRAFHADRQQYYPGVNAASLLQASGRECEAALLYEEVLKVTTRLRSRTRVPFWTDFTTGEVYLGLGRLQEALEAYRAGLGRDPSPSPRDLMSALKGVRRKAELMAPLKGKTHEIERLLGAV